MFHFHALEKEMATDSSVLVRGIPGTTEPGGLPPVGSHRVRHDWSDLAAAAAAEVRSEEGIVREFGMDMYTLLYLKWVTKKDLLYSKIKGEEEEEEEEEAAKQ